MAEARGDHITIEFDALANELENEMNSTKLTMSTECCIFKVPNILKRHNPKAYVPSAFSIGPYHYGKKHLKATQKIKLKYLRDLIYSYPGRDPMVLLTDLIGTIRGVEQEARDCYAEPIDHISRDEFVKILVLDGCFLIQLFFKKAEGLQKDDPVFARGCMYEALFHDLILLENQIPFQVLRCLFEETKIRKQTYTSLSILVLHYCYDFSGESDISPCSDDHGSKHILDLLRNSLILSSSITQGRNEGQWESMPSATRLTEAGVKFRKRTSAKSILDIQFQDGFLEIPQLLITESTEPRFRNLICLEQCLPNCDPIVTCYAMLLDNLINTTEDMEILCEKRIINNWLNIDDATGYFNQLYDNAFVNKIYYAPLIAQVKKYCGRCWPRNRALLMHDYFKNPWAVFSVIAAGVLLILTVVQTIFSIIK